MNRNTVKDGTQIRYAESGEALSFCALASDAFECMMSNDFRVRAVRTH